MSNDPLSAWSISEDDYPVRGTATDQMIFCLNYAVLAPSSHNSQPWRFRVESDTVWLHADRSRTLAFVDPHGREAVISCGSALLNLRLALHHFGHAIQVRWPSAREFEHSPELLAVVHRGLLEAAPRPDEERLFRAIPRRHTNRQAYRSDGLPEGLFAALSAIAIQEGAWLEPVSTERDRLRLADLIAEGDRQQWHDAHFRQELASWIHPNRSNTRDGMPGSTFGIGDLASFFGPLAVRTFDRGDGQAATDHQLATGSPGLAVLGTRDDSPQAWLAAGQALQRVLLRATADGISTSYLNQPVEIPELRSELASLMEHRGFPQIILRLGYGVDVRPTPRRRMEDVVVATAEPSRPEEDFELPEEPAA